MDSYSDEESMSEEERVAAEKLRSYSELPARTERQKRREENRRLHRENKAREAKERAEARAEEKAAAKAAQAAKTNSNYDPRQITEVKTKIDVHDSAFETILKMMRRGLPLADCCALAGVTSAALQSLVENEPLAGAQLKAANSAASMDALSIVKEGEQGWASQAWILERQSPRFLTHADRKKLETNSITPEAFRAGLAEGMKILAPKQRGEARSMLETLRSFESSGKDVTVKDLEYPARQWLIHCTGASPATKATSVAAHQLAKRFLEEHKSGERMTWSPEQRAKAVQSILMASLDEGDADYLHARAESKFEELAAEGLLDPSHFDEDAPFKAIKLAKKKLRVKSPSTTEVKKSKPAKKAPKKPKSN